MSYTFDGVAQRISLGTGVTSLDLRDLYSRWKEFVQTTDSAKFLPAFRTVGGDPIDEGAGVYITSYFVLLNGWRIKPQEAHHKLTVTSGVIVVDGGGDPFISTTGAYNVLVQYSQPVRTETVALSGGGGATPAQIASAVWQSQLSEQQLTGSFGEFLQKKILTVGKFLGLK